jgi:alanine racemase
MQPTRQANLTSIRRDAWIEVDLNSLEHNLRVLQDAIATSAGIPDGAASEPAGNPNNDPVERYIYKGPNRLPPQFMAVVKGDAYGHGAVQLSQLFAATHVDYLGVASIDEGRWIREAGVKLPILILSPTPAWAIDSALENSLDITVSSEKQLANISQKANSMGRQAPIHLKVDTGMHRLGVPLRRLPEILQTISQDRSLRLVGVWSHLANASQEESVMRQKEAFDQAVELTRPLFPETIFHLASSEATTRFPQCHYDMVRVGIYLYGLEPNTVSDTLQPALSVRARINQTNAVAEGERVGYGHTWQAQRPSRLAAIPIGYADGVDRGLSNRMKGLLMGQVIAQVGRISMDQMLFDITDVPQAEEGDVITLIGSFGQNSLYLSEWANSLDTITYELACRLRVRLPRIYTRNESPKAPTE